MQYLLTPYNYNNDYFAYWDQAFNQEELNYLQNLAKNSNQPAFVGNGDTGAVNLNVRRSNVSWLACSNENVWIFERLAHVVSSLNAQFFRFDLTGFGENIQLTSYNQENLGNYDWHVDFSHHPSSPSRKLSLVLQLSDPCDYEGGDLEIKPTNNIEVKIEKKRGLIVCFPSWTLHNVTPVLSGTRQSLVAWISGPSFR